MFHYRKKKWESDKYEDPYCFYSEDDVDNILSENIVICCILQHTKFMF